MSISRLAGSLVLAILPTMAGAAPAGETPGWRLSLDQAVESTLQNSARLKSAESAAAAAQSAARAQFGALLPRLSLDGTYRYLTKLPDASLPPSLPVTFLTHNAYSIGPAARLTLFDGGALYKNWRSAQADARAQELQTEAIRRQLRLAARLAYFQALLASEQVRLLAESYRVESAQYEDIRLRARVGAASSGDALASHQKALVRQRQFLQARADLAVAIRELDALTRRGLNADVSLPLDDRTPVPLAAELEPPTFTLALDGLAEALGRMERFTNAAFDPKDPRVQHLAEVARAARLTAQSLAGANWPALSLLVKSTLDYPDIPNRENIHQNTIGLFLSFPFFTGGATTQRVKQMNLLAKSSEEQREQTVVDLQRDWNTARDRLTALRAQEALDRRTVEEADQLARLRYESYQAGQSRYLDVEDANLGLLEAKVEASRTKIKMLVELADLESLGLEQKEQP
ncbi:MAG: TolC family protein [Elusimicrobia bacterium]|nr:TolC family protein [Elusimicrobiota bacterium]